MILLSLILATLFLGALICFPLLTLFSEGVVHSSAVLFFDPLVLSIVRVTFFQAFVSTALSLVLGLILGSLVRSPMARRYWGLSFSIPTVAAASCAVNWLGYRHGLGLAYTWWAVVIAHVYLNAPWVAQQVAEGWSEVSTAQWESSRTLGANYVQSFCSVVWPRLKWHWGAAGVQVFALCVTSFALVLLLGGGPPVETLETSIFSHLRGRLDFQSATVCALWQCLLTLVPWVILLRLKKKKNEVSLSLRLGVPHWGQSHSFVSVLQVVFVFAVLFPFFPQLYLLHSLFASTKGGAAAFSSELFSAFMVSIQIALSSTFVTLLLSLFFVFTFKRSFSSRSLVCGVWSRCLEWVLAIPSGASVLVLGLGAWIAYGRWWDFFSDSRGIALIGISTLQATVALPWAYRRLWAVAQTENRIEYEAIRTLGAKPFQAWWRVEGGRWKRAVFAVGAWSFSAALGELTAVSLFANESTVPLSLLNSRLMSQYRFEESQLVSAILLSVSLLVTIIVMSVDRQKVTSLGVK